MARNTKDLWNRDGMFSARFRVPKRYKNLVNRTFFVESLGTDSEADALVLAAAVKSRVMADWALLAGGSAHQTATARWQGLKDIARSAGHRRMTAPEIAEAPIEEIRGRIDVLRKNPAPDLVAALLDPGAPPQDMLSQLLDLSERSLYRQRKNKKKSEGKMVLWRQTRRRAIGNFIAALAARDGGSGDKPIAKIDSEDAWELHDWWEKKVEQDNLIPGTANKDFYYIGSMISDYYRLIKNRQPPRPFAGVTMDESDTEERHRLPLPIEWIEETLIAPHPKLAELMSRNMPDGTPKTGRAAKAAEVAREGDDADPQFCARIDRPVVLDPAVEDRVARLMDEAGNAHSGKNALGLACLLFRIGGDPDIKCLALAMELGERAHGLLERGAGIEPMGIEDVEIVESETLEAMIATGDQVFPAPEVAIGA